MTPEQIKQKVKQAFTNVNSAEFLQEQIRKGVNQHRMNFREFKAVNPDKSFKTWKERNEKIEIDHSDDQTVMARGIFLLSLDEFEKELRDEES